MSIDDAVTAGQPGTGPRGEVEQALVAVDSKRFRGRRWLPVDEVTELCRRADHRLDLMRGEIERGKREFNHVVKQLEMYRHGALATAVSAQGPDPMVLELTMRAQDEANRTLGEASAEGAEIIAAARSQAAEIVAQAHRYAAETGAHSGPDDTGLLERIKELEARIAELVAASSGVERMLSQWEQALAEQAVELRHGAGTVGAISQEIRAAIARD